MILQSLRALYDRLSKEENKKSELPSPGFSLEDIGFAITIDRKGNLIGNPEDLRKKNKAQRYEGKRSIVPYSNEVNVRSSNAATTPNFMVDRAEYIFGMSDIQQKNVHRDSFRELIDEVCGNSQNEEILAVKSFLRNWNPPDSTDLPYWKEICGPYGKWVGFKLEGIMEFIHERPEVRKLWEDFVDRKNYRRGISLVDGMIHELQTQYAQFPFGTGASLVSFNETAYESYGKKRGGNAPISVEAEFKSSTALKHLLRNDTQRLRIGDATTLFWAERKTLAEVFMGMILDPRDEDEAAKIPVRKYLEAAEKGKLPNELKEDGEVKFYILGLALNKARLSLRFWYVCSVAELADRLGSHFQCLKMERNSEEDIRYPGIEHLLKETARKTKDKETARKTKDKETVRKAKAVLRGALMRSILTGSSYPMNLYQGVMGRIRADRDINYLKASILKAVLKRNYKKEIPMSLNTEKRETAYLLGRLFAVLEKAQLDASERINTTIKGYFTAAASTPASVFPRLLQLSQHHIKKAEYGFISDKRIEKIMEHIEGFPLYMNLQDQGLFAIAYYQQRNQQKNETYRKKTDDAEGENHE